MTRAVVTGHAGAIEDERHTRTMQRAVQEHLVDRAIEECRVDGDHGMQAGVGHAGGACRCVLLGDADVEGAVGILLREAIQAGGTQHGRGDAHDAGVLSPDRHELVGEDGRPGATRRTQGLPCLGINHADAVEPVGLVLLGGGVAATLLGDHVDDDRPGEVARATQRVLDLERVVTVDGPDVLQAQVLEHPLRGNDVLQPLLHAVESLVDGGADDRRALQGASSPLQEPLVALRRTQRREVMGQPADGRRVRPLVVVDQDDHRAIGRGDVVERLPCHATGERAIAHHGDDMSSIGPGQLALDLERLRDAVGVGQCGRGVRVLDDVMLGLRPRRVAGQTTLLAERVEVTPAPGEDLVDVCLVTGVPQDDVVGRVEDAMQGEGHLDDSEVRAEMATSGGHLAHEELPDLLGQAGQVLLGDVTQVRGRADAVEQTHAGLASRPCAVVAQLTRAV